LFYINIDVNRTFVEEFFMKLSCSEFNTLRTNDDKGENALEDRIKRYHYNIGFNKRF